MLEIKTLHINTTVASRCVRPGVVDQYPAAASTRYPSRWLFIVLLLTISTLSSCQLVVHCQIKAFGTRLFALFGAARLVSAIASSIAAA